MWTVKKAFLESSSIRDVSAFWAVSAFCCGERRHMANDKKRTHTHTGLSVVEGCRCYCVKQFLLLSFFLPGQPTSCNDIFSLQKISRIILCTFRIFQNCHGLGTAVKHLFGDCHYKKVIRKFNGAPRYKRNAVCCPRRRTCLDGSSRLQELEELVRKDLVAPEELLPLWVRHATSSQPLSTCRSAA